MKERNLRNDTLLSTLFAGSDNEITCNIVNICIFESWGLLTADQIFSCSLDLLELYRTLCQLILQQLREDSKRENKLINQEDS